MNQEQTPLKTAKSVILFAVIFLFPLFFLPLTQEYFNTNKIFLLAAAALGLLGISLAEMVMTKKLVWEKRAFDTNLLLFLAAIVLSVLITAPNKVMTLLNANFGVIPVVSMAILAFYIARTNSSFGKKQGLFEGVNYLTVLTISTVILSLVSIFMFFQPFRSVALPPFLQFLAVPTFTPIGSQLDLAVILGFVSIALTAAILTTTPHEEETQKDGLNQPMIAAVVSVSIILIGLIFTMFQILKPQTTGVANPVLLPPYRLSWYAAVESLKNPLTAVFGIGMNSFSSIFAAVKDPLYNQSNLWQVQSFNVARSTILHILATTGVFGLVAFFLLIMNATRSMVKHKISKMIMALFAFTVIIFVFMPPSLTIFFLYFIVIGMIAHNLKSTTHSTEHHQGTMTVDLAKITPLYAGLILISVLLLGGSAYVLGVAYASEYYFKQSLNALIANNAEALYNNQRNAIIMNPYNDRFRISYSQTNLLIANNLAAQANQRQLNDTERQTIIQTIQTAIQEAKAAVILNPTSAANWENLAVIYKNILNIAQGADGWTVASYQRAIALDPQNPSLWLNLGGVYYSLGNYEQAARMFEQAVTLKPDWPNALYNLAWAAEQRGDHVSAAIVMQRVLTLMDPVKDAADYKKAQADFESFRAKITAQQQQAAQQNQQQPQQLSLPTPPAATLEPKLKIPSEPESPEPPIIPREQTNNQGETNVSVTPSPTIFLSPTKTASPSGR